jgi:hypothetical protein
MCKLTEVNNHDDFMYMQLLLEAVVNHMAEFESSLTPSLFEALKDVQSKYYYNKCLKPEKLSQ